MTDERAVWVLCMSSIWLLRGLLGHRQTEVANDGAGSPVDGTAASFPELTRQVKGQDAILLAARCPTGALLNEDEGLSVDLSRCIQCGRCAEGASPIRMNMQIPAARWRGGQPRPLPRPFRKSIHIRVVDAGDCGACLNEVRQLNNPFYNMHRLGFFLTPSPRHADILLVVGSGTAQMRYALEAAYAAMPGPHLVMAVGQCALHGNLWSGSMTGGAGVSAIIPVDVEVVGAPPSPRGIIQALLMAAGRTGRVAERFSASVPEPEEGTA